MLNLLIPSYAEPKGFGPSAHEDCNRLWIYWTAWLQPRKNMCGVPGIWVVWMESNTWIINRIRRQEYLHFFKVPLAAHRDLKNPPDLQEAPSLCKVIPAFHVLVQLQKSWNNWQHVWLLGWKIQVLNLCLAFFHTTARMHGKEIHQSHRLWEWQRLKCNPGLAPEQHMTMGKSLPCLVLLFLRL